jgi:hypothetical protein
MSSFRSVFRRSRAALVLGLGAALAARATTVVPPEFSTLVNGSDSIVRARVKTVTAEPRARTDGNGTKIVTRVEFEVLEVVAGTPPTPCILEFLGGRVGTAELVVHGMPRFHVGDEDVLFVSGNGRTICPLYAMMYGRYPILTDAATGQKYVARADNLPLRNTAEIGRALQETTDTARPAGTASAGGGLSPAAFAQSIRAAIDPYGRLQRAPQ